MRFFLLIPVLFLSACADGKPKNYLRLYDIPEPSIERFTHCYDYGCKTRAIVSLSKKTQKQLRRNFRPKPKTAKAERKKIATAIQIFEKNVGAITGTKNDKFGTFRLYQDDAKSTNKFQQDCIDESTNTTIYLSLLEQMGLLQFHHPIFPTTRQPLLSGGRWWHQSAVIRENGTENAFAVDSWFRDNGHPAFIIPLKEWKNGWKPQEKPQ